MKVGNDTESESVFNTEYHMSMTEWFWRPE